MLHKLPPPDTSVRQRKGYRQLDPEEDTTVTNETLGVPTIENDEEPEDTSIRDTVQHDGWRSLSWSFAASGFMTVRSHLFHLYHLFELTGLQKARRLLFPSLVCDSIVRKLFSS